MTDTATDTATDMATDKPETNADDAAGPEATGWRRVALEGGPLLLFFLVNAYYGIMVGTAALMIATTISVALSWRLENRIPVMPLIGAAGVLVFGGLTLWLDDSLFIKIKPTVINLLFAAAIFGGLLCNRLVMKLLFGSLFALTDVGWRILSWRLVVYFTTLALLNEIVWRNFSDDAWVAFKVFGILPLTMVFWGFQVPLILRHQAGGDPRLQAKPGDAAQPSTDQPA